MSRIGGFLSFWDWSAASGTVGTVGCFDQASADPTPGLTGLTIPDLVLKCVIQIPLIDSSLEHLEGTLKAGGRPWAFPGQLAYCTGGGDSEFDSEVSLCHAGSTLELAKTPS